MINSHLNSNKAGVVYIIPKDSINRQFPRLCQDLTEDVIILANGLNVFTITINVYINLYGISKNIKSLLSRKEKRKHSSQLRLPPFNHPTHGAMSLR